MVLYGQMSREQSFHANQLYRAQLHNRVPNQAIENNAIYTAIAMLETQYSPHKSVAFPVRLESITPVEEPQARIPLGILAMKIVLLDQDFNDKQPQPFQAIVQDGLWHVNDAIPVDEAGTNPVTLGYFLVALPNDPEMHKFTDNDGKPDPRSISY